MKVIPFFSVLARAGLFASVLAATFVSAQDPEALATLKVQFELKWAEIAAERDRQIGEGLGKYRTLVAAALQKAKTSGNLESTKRLTEESRVAGTTIDYEELEKHEVPEVGNLRQGLRQVVEAADRRSAEQSTTLIRQYLRPLERMKPQFVTQGDIAAAEKVHAEIERIGVELLRIEGAVKRGVDGLKLPLALNKGLTVRLSFSENEAGMVTDESGNGHNGAVAGATWVEDGKIGGAFAFDGIDDEIRLVKDLPDSAAVSISVWIFYDGQGNDGGIFADYTGAGGNDLLLSLAGAGSVHIRADKSGAKLRTTLGLDRELKNRWHHLVWTMTPNESIVYLDGKKVDSVSAKGSNVGFHGASLGHSNDGARFLHFKGKIDEFMMWDRALTKSEVEELHEVQQ